MGDKTVSIFHVGPQKCGTTWVYRCLQEHPEINCPPHDKTHYFSMYFHRGREWYLNCFGGSPKKILFDPTPNYLRSPLAPKRIFEENPKSKIIMCFRHPIERAFSHYWHEKKKFRFNFKFEEVLDNYDLFTNWVEPGFYALHLERYLKYFSKEKILVQFFDDLQDDPETFLQELLRFVEIDSHFKPSVLHKKINVALPPRSPSSAKIRKMFVTTVKGAGLYRPAKFLKHLMLDPWGKEVTEKKMETLQQVKPKVIEELAKVFEPDIMQIEALLNVDLSHWRIQKH